MATSHAATSSHMGFSGPAYLGILRGVSKRSELRGTLGTLLRSTWEQMGSVREVVGRQAKEGKRWIDDALWQREHRQLLAELGDIVCDLIEQGDLDLSQLPELAQIYEDIQAHEQRAPEGRPPSRSAGRNFEGDTDPGSHGAGWREPHEADDPDDGTVGAFDAWGRPRPAPTVHARVADFDSDLEDYKHPDDLPAKPEKPE